MGGHVACLKWSVEDVSVIDTWQAPIGLREGHVAEPGWSTCQTVIGGQESPNHLPLTGGT